MSPIYLNLFVCIIFVINSAHSVIAMLISVFDGFFAEQSKIYFAKCEYLRASQYGVYAKGVAAGGIFCTIIVLVLVIAIITWSHVRYMGY